MTELTSYFILAFSSLFTLVNPIGLSPVFLSMVDHCDDKERQKIALKGVLTALVVLIIFTFLGRLVFSFFGITVSGFKIAGEFYFLEPAFKCWKPGFPEPVLLLWNKLKLKPRRKLPIHPLEFPLLQVLALFHR